MGKDYSKRYWVIYCAHHYPQGFLDDVDSTHDSLAIAGIRYTLLEKENGYWGDVSIWDNKELRYLTKGDIRGKPN